MKKISTHKNIGVLLSLLLLLGVGSSMAQTRKPVLRRKPIVHRKVVPAKPAEPLYSVSSGTVLHSRMNSNISSKSARIGDTFNVTVTEPVYSSNGVVVIPTGATLTGRVNTVRPAANQGKPGQIDVSFTRLSLPNGRTRLINGSLTDLTSGKSISDNEGGVSGKQMGHRKAIFIGGGGVGGVLLGGAIGGGKGALIGGLLGAGGGFLGDRLTKGPEAEVRSGTEFGVYLNQAISLPRFGETTGPRSQ